MGLLSPVWHFRDRRGRVFAILLALCSLLAVCPGFYFRPHYFVLTLPAAALLAAVFVGSLQRDIIRAARGRLMRAFPLLLAAVGVGATLIVQGPFLFQMTPAEASRSTYGLNPFPESPGIARFVASLTEAEDRIAVLGSEPQLYFYAKRRAATGFVYMYPLMESHPYALKMQETLIGEIERSEPEVMVFVNVATSWLKRESSAVKIFEWFEGYQQAFYDLAGLVEITPSQSFFHQAPDIPWPPRHPNFLVILKRKAL
jgi:hypothetical protein